MSMPDNNGTTGRDGSARETKATASPKASRPTVNFISAILALATDISERRAVANPGDVGTGWSGRPGRCGSQRRLDRAGQVPGGLRGQFHRYPRRRSLRRVDEVKVQRVIGQGVGRVVEVDADLAQPEPAARALPAAGSRHMLS